MRHRSDRTVRLVRATVTVYIRGGAAHPFNSTHTSVRVLLSITCLLFIAAANLPAQTLSTETIFRRFLVSGDTAIAEMLIRSDSVYGTYVRALKLKNPHERRALLTRFIEMKPAAGVPDAYLWRGASYQAEDISDSALADFSTSISLDDGQFYAYYFRGATYRDLKKFEESIADFTKAIEREPKFYLAFHLRGLSYLDLEKLDKALADLDSVVELAPRYPAGLMMRAHVLKKLGRTDDAVADWKTVVEIGEDFTEAARKNIDEAAAKK